MAWFKRKHPVLVTDNVLHMNEVESPAEQSSLSRETARRFEYYLATSRVGLMMDCVNFCFSIASFVIYVSSTYLSTENFALQLLDTIFGIYFIFIYIINLMVAKEKLRHLTNVISLIDLITLIPVFVFRFPVDSAGRVITTNLIYGIISFLRVLRIVRIRNSRRLLIEFLEGEVEQQVVSLFFTVISITCIAAGLIYILENNENLWNPYVSPYPPYPFGLPFHDVIYLIVTTITTVGYGDIAPKTTLGRVVIMLMMCSALIMVPRETNKLVAIMSKRSVYGRLKYTSIKGVKHVIVCGAVNDNAVEFFQEFFHEDHGNESKHAVIIDKGLPGIEIQSLLRNPKYALCITYLEGNVMDYKDLERACVRSCSAVFVLTNKFSPNASEDDAITILKALSIKRYVFSSTGKDILTCLQLIRPESKKIYRSSSNYKENDMKGTSRSLDRSNSTKEIFANNNVQMHTNQIVCIEELKLNLLAKSCLCPGISTMLCNLVTTINTDGMNYEEKWMEEYGEGFGNEIYRVPLSPCFEGLTFLQASLIIYEESNSLLFALEMTPKDMSPRVFLNPCNLILPDCETYNIFGIVIAQDRDAAEIISKLFGGNKEVSNNDDAISRMEKKVDEIKKASKEKELPPLIALSPTLSPNTESPKSDEAAPSDEELAGAKKSRSRSLASSLRKSVVSAKKSADDESPIYLENDIVPLDHCIIHDMETSLPYVSNHIIIIGNVTSVYNFILPLRQKHLKQITPIVIMHTNLPSKVTWNKIALFPRVFFLQASSLELSSLKKAGIETASRIVILAKEIDEANYDLVDAHSIFTYRIASSNNIENLHIICELVSKNNTNFLIDLKSDEISNNEQYFSPVYASGNSFSSGMLDTLLCQAFYNPHIITIVSSLVSNSDISEEENWNRKLFLNGLGFKGNPSPKSSTLFSLACPPAFIGKPYLDLFRHIKDVHSCLIIGLNRAVEKNGLKNSMPFVSTNPSKDIIINEGDKMFLLGQTSLAAVDPQHAENIFIKPRSVLYDTSQANAKEIMTKMKTEIESTFFSFSEQINSLKQAVKECK